MEHTLLSLKESNVPPLVVGEAVSAMTVGAGLSRLCLVYMAVLRNVLFEIMTRAGEGESNVGCNGRVCGLRFMCFGCSGGV